MSSHNNQMQEARSSVLLGFTEHCRRHRINPMQILARENLTPAVTRSQDLRIPYRSFVRVLDHAAAESPYPLFSLTLSLRHGIEALGALGLMACQCDTLRDSLEMVRKYVHYHAQGVELELTEQNGVARLSYNVRMAEKIDLTQLMEVGIGRIFSVLKTLAPPGMSLTGVSFRHAPTAPIDAYTRELGLEPRFRAGVNAVCFPASFLALPPSPAPERLRHYFESFLRQNPQENRLPLKQQVIKLIHEMIPTGEVSAEAVAKLMNMHTRSLQRQLRLNDTDFRTLLEEVRYQLAQDALRNIEQPLTEVALQLGYSELSAFSRAFKRWSGVSPQKWRATSG